METVDAEISRLAAQWAAPRRSRQDPCAEVLGERVGTIDRFDHAQLREVIEVCRASRTASEAGRTLFAISRVKRSSTNDADRLRKYLAKFGLDFDQVRGS